MNYKILLIALFCGLSFQQFGPDIPEQNSTVSGPPSQQQPAPAPSPQQPPQNTNQQSETRPRSQPQQQQQQPAPSPTPRSAQTPEPTATSKSTSSGSNSMSPYFNDSETYQTQKNVDDGKSKEKSIFGDDISPTLAWIILALIIFFVIVCILGIVLTIRYKGSSQSNNGQPKTISERWKSFFGRSHNKVQKQDSIEIEDGEWFKDTANFDAQYKSNDMRANNLRFGSNGDSHFY
jgi:hypothetical protein